MALSEKEQRLLEQLEAALAAEDPKFASTLRGSSHRTLHRRRAALAGLGFLAGVAALVAGMQVAWWLSVLGFIVMFAFTIVALSAWRHVDTGGRHEGIRPDKAFTDRPQRPDDRF
ncbi:DUF3040 domain-containing protein [Propioniciclava soli]|uniref:DUF3040 domain-containing protein n=1 Tax=Propioniciclava soli TaxID=2775081 RepID=A0ABZ3C4M6_9ACTN